MTSFGAHNHRLVHVLDRNGACELSHLVFVDDLAILCESLVLGVDPVLGLLNVSVLKLFEIVVLIALRLVSCITIALVNKVKRGIVDLGLFGRLSSGLHHGVLDLILVLLVDLLELGLNELVISRLAIPVRLLDLLEVLEHVSLLDLVIAGKVVPPLPLANVQGSENDSERDKCGQVEREGGQVAIVAVAHKLSIGRVDQLDNHDVVARVGSQPEEDEVGAEHLVVTLRLQLGLLVRSEGLLTCRGRSVAPRHIVQVAHRVDLE